MRKGVKGEIMKELFKIYHREKSEAQRRKALGFKRTYRVEYDNGDFFAIIDTANDELVMNGNWNYLAERLDRTPDDIDLLESKQVDIRNYEATGLTVWERYNNALREGYDALDKYGQVSGFYRSPADAEKHAATIGGTVSARAERQAAHNPRW
jgi:hypothetical protein